MTDHAFPSIRSRSIAMDVLSEAAVFTADFATATYRSVTGLTRMQALASASVTASIGSGIDVAPVAVTNLLPNLPLAGAALGVLGAGGALPTGWENSFAGVQKEVLAFDASSITLKLGPQSSGSFGGVRLPSMSPAGPVVVSFDVEGGLLPALSEPPAQVAVGWFKDGATAAISQRLWWTGDWKRRVSVILPQPEAGSRLAVVLTAGTGAPSQTPIVRLGNMRVDLVATVGSRSFGQPPYGAGATLASTTVLRVPDGQYVLVVETTEGVFVRRRITVSGGLDLAAALGGWFSVARLWVIPAAQWTPARADTLMGTDPDWESPVIRFASNESSAALVMQAMDRTQNAGPSGDVAGSSADSAALRSIGLSRRVPGVMHFNVAPGDRAPFDGVGQERAEIHVPDKMPYDADIWVSLWVRINSYPPDTGSDESSSVFQLRYTNDPGDTTTLSPEFTFRMYPKAPSYDPPVPSGYVRMCVITNSTTAPPPANTNNLTIRGATDIQVGVWHHLVARVNVSRTGGGYLQYWINGVEKWNASTPVGANRQQGPTVRVGVYSNAHVSSTRDVEIREVIYSTVSLADRVQDIAPL